MGDEVEDAVTQGKGLKGKLIKRGIGLTGG